MTTIIIIVVVALVFFVTVCVVTFMVWKREAEMRTDSIRAIESNLEKLGEKLAGENPLHEPESDKNSFGRTELYESTEFKPSGNYAPRRKRSKDPFDWVHEEPEETGMEIPHNQTERISPGDIDAENVESREETDARQTAENQLYDISQTVSDDALLEDIISDDITPDIPDSYEFDSIELPDLQTDEFMEDYDPEMEDYDSENESEMAPETETVDYEPEQTGNTEKYQQYEPEEEPAYAEISLDFEIPQESEYNFAPKEHRPLGHDVGRSGRKYTSEELDVLIKE